MTPAEWIARAMQTAQQGNMLGACNILADARKAYPQDASLWHAAGTLLLHSGDTEAAAAYFEQAFTLDPKNFDCAIDQAIALSALDRNQEALAVLVQVEKRARKYAHYCSTRANAERGAGHGDEAAKWYDRALKIEPTRPKALAGRAAVALERGEATAVERFDRALQINPDDIHLLLGKAQALDVAGQTAEAREVAEFITGQVPQFIPALHYLAQVRMEAGEEDFTAHYRDAMRKAPLDPAIADAWARTLAGYDRNAEAADVAAEARTRYSRSDQFALLEAVYAGAAGDDARAEGIFAGLTEPSDARNRYETRHRIRRGEYDRAAQLLDLVHAQAPDDVDAWALRGFLWRLTDDPREDWLHGQAGLVELLPLHDADRVLGPAIALLEDLHQASPMPIGQSLRGGSQTRGRLFDRPQRELQALRKAILRSLEDYRAHLPPADDTHPMLQHRDASWHISGSWSVRLTGGKDRHASHIHPEGIVSSALYLKVPADMASAGDQQGCLELGRPPPDLRIDLPPIRTIAPREGHLALFPSTLYHNTRPFGRGTRMTVAFDVAIAEGQ